MPVSPAASLIASDNRLLGWGLTDLSLYGAPAAPGLTVGPARDDVALAPAAPLGGEGAPVLADPQTLAPPLDSDSAPVAAPAEAATPAAPTAFHAASVPAAAPSVPLPVGSGTAVQPSVATPLQAVEEARHGPGTEPDHAAAAAPPIPTNLTEAVAPAATLVAPALTVTEAVGPSVQAFADHLLDAPAVLPAITGLVATAPADVLGGVGAVAHDLAATVGTTATGGLETTTTGLVDALAGAAAIPHDATDLHGLGGADPAGGVATLVGMVASAEVFDLGHAGAPTAATPAPSILDALAADAVPSPLLGDHHHDDAGAGHGVDDHGLHFGL